MWDIRRIAPSTKCYAMANSVGHGAKALIVSQYPGLTFERGQAMNYSVIIWKDVIRRRTAAKGVSVEHEVEPRRIKVGEIACEDRDECEALAMTLNDHGKGFEAQPVFVCYQPTGGRALLPFDMMADIAAEFLRGK